ncbi:MAG: D-TA family PLP-dependent enzyme [Verrucomicrobiales bacterium]|nr:D-TA family PLP-dependent enzyme [Verrucomicrobiales bacterium]
MRSITGVERVPSPGLLFDADAIDRNLARMLAMVGSNPALLRPHIKTHKCAEILEKQIALGITSAKCATLAEAELAAQVGVSDILISYPLVGPNVAGLATLVGKYPASKFSTLVDSEAGLAGLGQASVATPLSVFLDLDIGMHRTGIAPSHEALALVQKIIDSKALRFAGLHAYDGHIHTAEVSKRRSEFDEAISELDGFLATLAGAGIDVPLIVSGGTPTYAFHAKRSMTSATPSQCSPGTPVLWDAGYGQHYPDLGFEPAAFLLTRVISHPGGGLACLDLGHKAVSAENPILNRVRFPELEILEFVSQSEEHLVIRTAPESRLEIGAEVLGIPYHVCPCVALYDEARIIRGQRVTDEIWKIPARNRVSGRSA